MMPVIRHGLNSHTVGLWIITDIDKEQYATRPERSKDKRYQAQSLTRTALTTSQDNCELFSNALVIHEDS